MKIYAGGIRNPKSTCYINCTLQTFLHFTPFVEALSDETLRKNYLVKVLFILSNNMKNTRNSISADSLISYFSIDPNIQNDINYFLSLFYSNLPDAFKELIYIQNYLWDVNNNDKNFEMRNDDIKISEKCKMVIFQNSVNEINHNKFEIHKNLTFNNHKFEIYAIVLQFAYHHFVLIRDINGWIYCNDSSLSEISESEVNRLINDCNLVIKQIVYASDLNLISIERRKPIFQSKKVIFDDDSEDIVEFTDSNFETPIISPKRSTVSLITSNQQTSNEKVCDDEKVEDRIFVKRSKTIYKVHPTLTLMNFHQNEQKRLQHLKKHPSLFQ